jgi:hypothetical protein
MAGYSETLKEMMDRIVGDRSFREAAEAARCDHTILFSMVRHGRIPRRETLRRVADGFGVTGRQRADLFAAAGYVELPEEVAAR